MNELEFDFQLGLIHEPIFRDLGDNVLCSLVALYVPRAFIYLFLIFWLHCAACGFLVLRPGIEPTYIGSVES